MVKVPLVEETPLYKKMIILYIGRQVAAPHCSPFPEQSEEEERPSNCVIQARTLNHSLLPINLHYIAPEVMASGCNEVHSGTERKPIGIWPRGAAF